MCASGHFLRLYRIVSHPNDFLLDRICKIGRRHIFIYIKNGVTVVMTMEAIIETDGNCTGGRDFISAASGYAFFFHELMIDAQSNSMPCIGIKCAHSIKWDHPAIERRRIFVPASFGAVTFQKTAVMEMLK